MDKVKQLKKILGEGLREGVVLGDYTTMKVGGVADYFYVAKNLDDLIKAVLATRELAIKYFILGGGSNILISDYGFKGLVILNRASNMAFLPDKSQVIADSGVSLSRLIIECADHGMSGLEPLFGIPGTLGGAIYGNSGANGAEICQFVKYITLLTPENKIVRYRIDWLRTEYRSTRLKNDKKLGQETPIILSAKIQLRSHRKEDIIEKIAFFQKEREKKQPHNQASAGSIFKNSGPTKKESAGFILDQLGAKKLKIKGASVSPKHANFIINNGRALTSDIRQLIADIKKLVLDRSQKELEEEIEYVGDFNLQD